MRKDAYTSSASGYVDRMDVRYRSEAELSIFKPKVTSVSSVDLYPPTTIKVASSVKGDIEYTTAFFLNIAKIAREEKNYRMNQMLSGKDIEDISTKNE